MGPNLLGLAYFLVRRGRIHTEMSVLAHGDDDFTLITAALAEWHDRDFLMDGLPAGLNLTNATEDISVLLVTGPKSRALFEGLTDADLHGPWLSHQKATVAGKACTLARVSFAGELGWEIHAPMADVPALYQAVRDAGATPFGMYALDRMRLEKGYRAWKQDLSTDYSLMEAGLARFTRYDKGDYTGKVALLAEHQRGVARHARMLTIKGNGHDAPYMSGVFAGDARVGEVTSCGYGYRVDALIALAMVDAEHAEPGTTLDVDIFGERCPATVHGGGALWDPQNERIRA